jgi:hypothetical protein
MSEFGIEKASDEIHIGVSIDKLRNEIVIRFTSPISWMRLTPAEASSFAAVILRKLKDELKHEKIQTTL